jgi:hypothetical protein
MTPGKKILDLLRDANLSSPHADARPRKRYHSWTILGGMKRDEAEVILRTLRHD